MTLCLSADAWLLWPKTPKKAKNGHFQKFQKFLHAVRVFPQTSPHLWGIFGFLEKCNRPCLVIFQFLKKGLHRSDFSQRKACRSATKYLLEKAWSPKTPDPRSLLFSKNPKNPKFQTLAHFFNFCVTYVTQKFDARPRPRRLFLREQGFWGFWPGRVWGQNWILPKLLGKIQYRPLIQLGEAVFYGSFFATWGYAGWSVLKFRFKWGFGDRS